MLLSGVYEVTLATMQRRTKIVATIGPASEDAGTLRRLVRAGMDVARLTLAHGSVDEAIERFRRIRQVAAVEERKVGILVDLPGPKVRSASFGTSPVEFRPGADVKLTVGGNVSNASVIEVDYDGLLRDVLIGDTLDIGDGRVVLAVKDKVQDSLVTVVQHGGLLTGRPGVYIPADRLCIPTPTPEDLVALDAFIELDVDMVAISFVSSADDMLRAAVEPHPAGPLMVSKIETRSAVANLASIIDVSGAVMVARGDLGNEYDIEELPHLQKQIISQSVARGRPVITATQMLESMITKHSPTRAEASDVANAVFDGSSAVMLSGETAIGIDPVNVVETMSRIAHHADMAIDYDVWPEHISRMCTTDDTEDGSALVTDAMTTAAWRAANELGVSVILAISGTGFTARSMARFRPRARIIALSHNNRTVHQLTVSWGVTSVLVDDKGSNDEMVSQALSVACDKGYCKPGDIVAVLAGINNRSPSSNVLRLERVPAAL